MDFGQQQFGKWLIVTGLVILLIGIAVTVLAKFGFFRLPGDIEFGQKNWRVFIPITTSILISVILTLVFLLINYFRR